MKKVPKQLITQAIQCIRLATHKKVDHQTVEQVARQLEQIRESDGDEYANQLQEAIEENEDDDTEEAEEE